MVCASCGDKFLQVLKMTNDNYMASFLSPDKNPVVSMPRKLIYVNSSPVSIAAK